MVIDNEYSPSHGRKKITLPSLVAGSNRPIFFGLVKKRKTKKTTN
jgi:hypothetical protein